MCRNGARDAPNAPFIGAQLIHGRVGRRTTVSANRRARKNPVEQIYWRPGFYSRGSLTVVARWLYGYPVLNKRRIARFPKSQTRLDPSAVTIGSANTGFVEIRSRLGDRDRDLVWAFGLSMGDFTRQPGTRNCPLHLPMPRSSQKIFIPAV